MNLQSFLAMGGYAFYVWTAYGVTFFVLLLNILWPMLQLKAMLRRLALKQKRDLQ
jgi:heme exporter protein D